MNLGIRDVIALGVPYLIAVGACYTFAYWGAFHINVLEFISFADVAKLAVYPLVGSLVFWMAGFLFNQVVFSPYFPPGGGSSSAVGKFGQKHWRWLDAHYVKTGASGQFVDVVRSKLPLENDENNRVSYLGYLGNIYILREAKTGQLVFVKQRDDSPLFLSSKPQ